MSIPELSIPEDGTALTLRWPGEAPRRIPASALRHAARDAQSIRHRHDFGDIPIRPGLHLTGMEPVGVMGVNIRFSDGCVRAIYPWDYLREIVARVSIN